MGLCVLAAARCCYRGRCAPPRLVTPSLALASCLPLHPTFKRYTRDSDCPADSHDRQDAGGDQLVRLAASDAEQARHVVCAQKHIVHLVYLQTRWYPVIAQFQHCAVNNLSRNSKDIAVNMTKDELETAAYFAELANLESTTALDEKNRRRLARGMLAIPQCRPFLLAEARRQGVQDTDVALSYLDALHHHVRDLLPRLLDGEAVIPPSLGARAWRVIDGGFAEDYPPSARALVYLIELFRRQRRFPFLRCPEATCRTIVVRVKRQKFCSPKCKDRHLATTHKLERRKYMREKMAERRARAKCSRATEAARMRGKRSGA